ncbi:MAG: hypothetical protein LBC71_07460 [Oscillospiraceae bacterium]|nr:hypothetical protein [Oscillospiraceae bacterium]
MYCAYCGTEEKAGVQFCRNCTAPLVVNPQPLEYQSFANSPHINNKKNKKSILSVTIPFALAAVLLFSLWIAGVFENIPGTLRNLLEVGSEEDRGSAIDWSDVDGEFVPVSVLVENLRQEFSGTQSALFQPTLWNVESDRRFYVDFESEFLSSMSVAVYNELLNVYMDSDLTFPINAQYKRERNYENPSIPEGYCRLYIEPSWSPARQVWGSYYDIMTRENIKLDEAGRFALHETGMREHWGYSPYFYLAVYVDPETNEPYDIPLVTIFTVENQLEAPQSEFFITEDGRGGFRWNEIEDADYYLIVYMDPEISEYTTMYPLEKVTDTYWVHPIDEEYLRSNWSFRNFDGKYDNYSVIAVNSEVHSNMGNVHYGENIATRLPMYMHWWYERFDAADVDGNLTFFYRDFDLLHTHRPIEMANREFVQRRVIYDFDNAVISDTAYAFWNWRKQVDDHKPDYWETHLNLHIPFTIEGTAFAAFVAVDINLDTYLEELEVTRKRMEKTIPRGGSNIGIELDNQKTDDAWEIIETPSTHEDEEMIFIRAADQVFANSALSAYFARNLLIANEVIDLTLFPESTDWEYLLDAFFEAIYQNPLVMHVVSAGTIPGTNILIVEYRESTETIFAQQTELRYVVPKIISEIITTDMSEMEKSFAINNYLIENSQYDFGALENAERNNFQFVDARFNDSFTAYGILINKVGVCAGYADAFKLLADEAGLMSIVVTGYLEGFLPHAWNRVHIDGHWHTIDVTNNANEFFLNAFLNLPDSAAGILLIEDDQFMMNDFIASYRSNTGVNEYYYVTGRFFDINNIAGELAGLIRQNGTATLRTDYSLDDESFHEIVMEVIEILNTDALYAFYMLGVIWMSESLP